MMAQDLRANIIDAFALPPDALVDIRIPKKILIDQCSPTGSDKRSIQDSLEELKWVATCKATSVGIPSFIDGVREYLEIAIVTCAFRAASSGNPTKSLRLTELIHRAIPYPVVLIAADHDGVVISVAHKRRAEREAGKTVIEDITISPPIYLVDQCDIEQMFIESLPLGKQPQRDLFVLYGGWQAQIEALKASKITGSFISIHNTDDIARRREALGLHTRLMREVKSLRMRIAQEKQLSRRVDINLEIQRRESELSICKKWL